MEKISVLIVKEVLNDFANEFELHLSKAKGLENLSVDEILFLSERELMENAIITTNNALDEKISGLSAINLILSSANADVRDDILWLELMTERSFLLKIEGNYVKSSLLTVLFDLNNDSKNESDVIKLIKNIKTLPSNIKKEVIDGFKNSNFLRINYKQLTSNTVKLLNNNGLNKKELLSNKSKLLERK